MNDAESVIVAGEISSIEAQKRARDRVSIFIGGDFAFGLHVDVLVSQNLSKGQVLSENDVSNLLREDEFYRARFKAYNLLSYRARTAHELTQRLNRSGYSATAVNRVINRLIELAMIDDEAFAMEFSQTRVRSKGYGPLRIRNELAKKGVREEFIASALSQTFESISAEELAAQTARKYFQRLQREVNPNKRRAKLTAYLARRGFTYDQMARALSELEVLDFNEG